MNDKLTTEERILSLLEKTVDMLKEELMCYRHDRMYRMQVEHSKDYIELSKADHNIKIAQ